MREFCFGYALQETVGLSEQSHLTLFTRQPELFLLNHGCC